jgi:hypothetical protein
LALIGCLLTVVGSRLPAQPTFARQFRWLAGTAGRGLECLPDGSYLVSGETTSDSFQTGVVVFRASAFGDTAGVRLMPGYEPGSGMLCRLTDNGYAVSGNRNTLQLTVSKFTAGGDSVWSWNSPYTGPVSGIVPAFDGGSLVYGRIPDTGASFGIVRLTPTGTESWHRYYRDPRIHGSWARGAAQTRDSGFILCGDCSDYQGPYLRLVRTNAIGDTLWTRIHADVSGAYFPAVRALPGAGFLVAGSALDTLTSANAVCIVRTDSLGTRLWSRSFVPPGTAGQAYALALTPDGGCILAAQLNWYDSSRVWLVRTDADGDSLWTGFPTRSVFPANLQEQPADIRLTSDGGFAVVGTSDAEGQSLLLFKTDSLGRIPAGVAEAPLPSPCPLLLLRIHPNPARAHVRISFGFSPAPHSKPASGCLRLYSASGRRIAALDVKGSVPGTGHWDLDIGQWALPPGTYFVELELQSPERKSRSAFARLVVN